MDIEHIAPMEQNEETAQNEVIVQEMEEEEVLDVFDEDYEEESEEEESEEEDEKANEKANEKNNEKEKNKKENEKENGKENGKENEGEEEGSGKKRACRYCGKMVAQSISTEVPKDEKKLKVWRGTLGEQFAENLKHTSTNRICHTHLDGPKRGPNRIPKAMNPHPDYKHVPIKSKNPVKKLESGTCRFCKKSMRPKQLVFVPIDEIEREEWCRRLGPKFRQALNCYKTHRICRSHTKGQGRYLKPRWHCKRPEGVEESSDDEMEEIEIEAKPVRYRRPNKVPAAIPRVPTEQNFKLKTLETKASKKKEEKKDDDKNVKDKGLCRFCFKSKPGPQLTELPKHAYGRAVWFRRLGPDFERTCRMFVKKRICISHLGPDKKPIWLYYRPLTKEDSRREENGESFVDENMEDVDDENYQQSQQKEIDNGQEEVNNGQEEVNNGQEKVNNDQEDATDGEHEDETTDNDEDSDEDPEFFAPVQMPKKAVQVERNVRPKRTQKGSSSATVMSNWLKPKEVSNKVNQAEISEPSTSRALESSSCSSNAKSKTRKSKSTISAPRTSKSTRSKAVVNEDESSSRSTNSNMVETGEPVPKKSRVSRLRQKKIQVVEPVIEEPAIEEAMDFAEVAELEVTEPNMADQLMDDVEMDQPVVEDSTLAEQPLEDVETVEEQMEVPAIAEPVENELGIQGDIGDLRNPEQVQMLPMVEVKEDNEDEGIEVKPDALIVVKQEAAIEENRRNGNQEEANLNNENVEAVMEHNAENANAAEEEQVAKYPCRRCERMFSRNMLMEIKDVLGVFNTWRPILGDQFAQNLLTLSAPHFICDEDQDILEAALDRKVPQ